MWDGLSPFLKTDTSFKLGPKTLDVSVDIHVNIPTGAAHGSMEILPFNPAYAGMTCTGRIGINQRDQSH